MLPSVVEESSVSVDNVSRRGRTNFITKPAQKYERGVAPHRESESAKCSVLRVDCRSVAFDVERLKTHTFYE